MYDNIYGDDKELDISAEPKPYSCDELPIDIGSWVSYMPYNDFDQRQFQLNSLLSLPIYNSYGTIKFVLSKHIDLLEQYLQNISNQIKITNTETVLETEVFYTSKIEGAKITRKRTQELHNGSPIQDNNRLSESMVLNNFKAVKMLNLYGNRLNEDILYKVWETLTDGCCQNEEIKGTLYRNGEVGITNSDFKAVPVDKIKDSIKAFLNFYESDLLNDKSFTKACILHYTFETIHPFCDGNGRLGRLIMNNYLISMGIESCRAVSFSEQIDKNRGLYDGAFISSENEYGDCTPFIEYMLQRMADAYITAKSL